MNTSYSVLLVTSFPKQCISLHKHRLIYYNQEAHYNNVMAKKNQKPRRIDKQVRKQLYRIKRQNNIITTQQ